MMKNRIMLISLGMLLFVIYLLDSKNNVPQQKDSPNYVDSLITMGIPENSLFYLDTNYHDIYIKGVEERVNASQKINDLRAYTKVVYFDKNGKMLSYNSDRMVPPIISVNSVVLKEWNKSGMYDTFPPTDIYNSPLALKQIEQQGEAFYSKKGSCKYIPFFELHKDSILKYMHPYFTNSTQENIEADYYVFIISRLFMNWETVKYQIQTVDDNLLLNNNEFKVQKFFILSDSLFMRPKY